MINARSCLLSLFFLLLATTAVQAQQRQKFSVQSFGLDAFAGTAQNEQYRRQDGSGALMAIIKVTSTTPGDDLGAYRFDFGNMRHEVVVRDDGDELWVYVQRNAKMVTITREGYTPIRNYDLGTAIQAGRTYNMQLSAQARPVQYQMVQFNVQPAGVGAVVLVKSSRAGRTKEKFGETDVNGSVANRLELGDYTYEVVADDYQLAEGSFTLADRSSTHIENVLLKPNFAEVTLQAADGADIYINDELKGTGQWTGRLRAGNHAVESRRQGHRPATTYITVEASQDRTFQLVPPVPVVGSLSVTSSPLGAAIRIDGNDYGLTPRMINDLLIGPHQVELALDGYVPQSQFVDIEEDNPAQVSMTLRAGQAKKTKAEKEPKPAKVKEPKPEKVKEPKPAKVKSGDVLLPPTSFYVQAGLQAGQLMAATASVGAYVGGFNVEATYGLGLAKSEDIYWNHATDPEASAVVCTYKPTLYGLRLGYGIAAGRTLRLTPQVGATVVSLKADGSTANATSATVGLRAELALAPHFALCAAPELAVAVAKSDVYKQLADVSSKVKGWSTGVGVRVGLCVSF